ncbi:MAG TPA: hypothetical protein VFT22_26130, partial [Kofleriaceae bacterium]|nr:hypothetical protein [Kofleriaceae bacterium]
RAGGDGQGVATAYFAFFYFALIAWVQGAHPDPVGMIGHLVEQHIAGLRPAPPPRRRSTRRPATSSRRS